MLGTYKCLIDLSERCCVAERWLVDTANDDRVSVYVDHAPNLFALITGWCKVVALVRVDWVVDVNCHSSSPDVLTITVVKRIWLQLLERPVVEPCLGNADDVRWIMSGNSWFELVPVLKNLIRFKPCLKIRGFTVFKFFSIYFGITICDSLYLKDNRQKVKIKFYAM